MVKATIADLAIMRRLSRKSDEVGPEDCVSTAKAYEYC